MQAADLSPVPVASRTQSGWDLFLLFAALLAEHAFGLYRAVPALRLVAG